MFGSGGLGDLLKGIDLNNLDFAGIAEKVVAMVPGGKGKQLMNVGLGVAKKWRQSESRQKSSGGHALSGG